MYAYGITANEVWAESAPWQGMSDEQIVRAVYRGQRPVALRVDIGRGDDFADDAAPSLNRGCLAQDPLLRPTAKEMLSELMHSNTAAAAAAASMKKDHLLRPESGVRKEAPLQVHHQQQQSFGKSYEVAKGVKFQFIDNRNVFYVAHCGG